MVTPLEVHSLVSSELGDLEVRTLSSIGISTTPTTFRPSLSVVSTTGGSEVVGSMAKLNSESPNTFLISFSKKEVTVMVNS